MNKSSDFLSFVPIFSSLDKKILEKILEKGQQKFYPKNTYVFREEEPGSCLFIIISGKVKVSRGNNDGKEVILSLLQESEFFGEMSLLDGSERSADVITLEDTELFLLDRADFNDLLINHPEVGFALLKELSLRLRAADLKIKSLTLKDSEGKVATILIELADNYGKIKNGIVEIDKLPFQSDLASMAGTSRETISRTLHTFAKKGLVEIDGPKLRILDYEKFKELYNN